MAPAHRFDRLITFVAVFCSTCGILPPATAAPFPDPVFGIDGTARLGDPGAPLKPTSAVALFDGRVVVSALATSGAATQTVVTRLAANGLTDPSFGSAGHTLFHERLYCVESQHAVRRFDESVDVLTSFSPASACAGGAVMGAGMFPNGARDLNFAVAGLPQATTPRPLAVAQDKNDHLYAAGTGDDGTSGYTFVARLTDHGVPDPLFGGSGPLTIESGPSAANRTVAVAPLDDGTVLTASLVDKTILFSRFDAHGFRLPAPNGAASVAVELRLFLPSPSDVLRLVAFLRLSDGANLAILKIEGAAKSSLLIIRAAADFSGSGTSRLIDSAPATDWPAAVALPDGTVVIAEVTGTGAARQGSLRRMFPNSSFDPTWGSARAYPLGAMTSITGLALDFSARLLITGSDGAGGFVKRYKLVADPFYETGSVTEFFNSNLNHFFMTADRVEVAAIEAGNAGSGWIVAGAFRVHTAALGVPAGAVRVCRFYGNREINPSTGQPFGPNSHVYVIDGPECDAVRRDRGWIFEQYAFYVFPAVNGQCAVGQLPVYRAYNGRFVQNDSNHRFTTLQNIYQQMIGAGWRGEGVVMCAPQQQ